MVDEPTVLDAWAALALLQGEEPAASRVAEALESDRAAMCWINLGEVAYIVERRHGDRVAAQTVDDLRGRLGSVVEAGGELTLVAARIKAGGGMSFADAFAAALAVETDAVLLTGDPELLYAATWRAEDLR